MKLKEGEKERSEERRKGGYKCSGEIRDTVQDFHYL